MKNVLHVRIEVMKIDDFSADQHLRNVMLLRLLSSCCDYDYNLRETRQFSLQ